MGSGFLAKLFLWIRTPGFNRANIAVCGNQTGLLRLCGACRSLTVCANLLAALNLQYSRV